MRATIFAIIAFALVIAPPSGAQDNAAGSWWDMPEVRRCCSIADAVWAEEWRANSDGTVTARVTGGGPRDHAWAPIGREYDVPADRIIAIPGNPTGRAMLFLHPSALSLYCFAPGPMI
ncbi:MAG: hypothetical protein ACK4MV_16430 [Beijerinckiaceae bacterium]